MATLAEYRAQLAAKNGGVDPYADLGDDDLAEGLHSKFYKDVPFDQFSKQVGLPIQQGPPDVKDLVAPQGSAYTDSSKWDKRADGTAKGNGWLGLLRRPDGGVSSEISIGIDMDGKEQEVPLIVPTLSRKEVDWLLNSPIDETFNKRLPPGIKRKAVEFARKRLAEGKSPFADPPPPESLAKSLTMPGDPRRPAAGAVSMQNAEETARIAQRLPGNIAKSAAGQAKEMVAGVTQGLARTEQGFQEAKKTMGTPHQEDVDAANEIVGQEELLEHRMAREGAHARAEQQAAVPADAGWGERAVQSGAASAAVSLPTILAAGPVGGSVLLGVGTGGARYSQLKEQGFDDKDAAYSGAMLGALETLTEYLPGEALVKNVPGFWKHAAEFMVKELPGENATSIAQLLDDYRLGLRDDVTLNDVAKELRDTSLATLIGGAGQVGVSHALKNVLPEVPDYQPTDEEFDDLASWYGAGVPPGFEPPAGSPPGPPGAGPQQLEHKPALPALGHEPEPPTGVFENDRQLGQVEAGERAQQREERAALGYGPTRVPTAGIPKFQPQRQPARPWTDDDVRQSLEDARAGRASEDVLARLRANGLVNEKGSMLPAGRQRLSEIKRTQAIAAARQSPNAGVEVKPVEDERGAGFELYVDGVPQVWYANETNAKEDAVAARFARGRPTEVLGQPIEAPPQDPTEGQAKAGNYRKPKLTWKDLPIRIETLKDTVRKGKDMDGTPWESRLTADYGYIEGTKDATGEPIDVFMGPKPDSDVVYVIDQLTKDRLAYDEPKVIVGTESPEEAKALYRSNYAPDLDLYGGLQAMPIEKFREWIKTDKTTVPVAWTPKTPAQKAAVESPRASGDSRSDIHKKTETPPLLKQEPKADADPLYSEDTVTHVERLAKAAPLGSKARADQKEDAEWRTAREAAVAYARGRIAQGALNPEDLTGIANGVSYQVQGKGLRVGKHSFSLKNIWKEAGKADTADVRPEPTTQRSGAELLKERIKSDKAKLIPKRTADGGVKWVAEPIEATPEGPKATETPDSSHKTIDDRAEELASKNTIYTEEEAQAALKILRASLGRANSGLDPEVVRAGITYTGYLIEKGARSFAAYAQAMIEALGDVVRPYLKSWYMAAKYDPRNSKFEGMSSAAEVETADVGEIDATRKLDSRGESALEGAPPEGVQPDDGERDARARTDDSGRPDESGDAALGERGDEPRASLGTSEGSAPVPARGARRERGSRPEPSVSSETPAPAGSQQPDDARREGVTAPIAFVPTDFTITDELELGAGGQKTKFKTNIAAIQLLKKLEAEQRGATPEEQATLAAYVGWGGIPQAFDANNSEWSKEHAQLKALLSDEEYSDARQSTQYAHYTSKEIIGGIYAALEHLGFTGGNILEPGSGVGNFIGLMPESLRTASRFTGVEREPIAVGIAQHLYPMQNIQRADFTEFKAPDGYFDAVIGNPPFASTNLTDRSGRKHLSRLSVHNYFIAKSVDLLREGGVLAVVVSNYFMDAQRDTARSYIAERTNFLGAIRLPNNAFSKNANTEVTTDIVFLQKRPEAEWGSMAAKRAPWLAVGTLKDVATNEYFIANPDMLLGDWGPHGTMYGPDQPALVARPGQDTAALLQAAIGKLPEKVFQPAAIAGTTALVDASIVKLQDPAVLEGGFYVEDGKLFQRQPDVAGEARTQAITPETPWTEKTKLGATGYARLVALSSMRVTLRDLLGAEMAGDKRMEKLRKLLNRQYDEYVKAHGYLNAAATARYFDDDPDYPLLAALEKSYHPAVRAWTGEYRTARIKGVTRQEKVTEIVQKEKAEKAEIFTRRVVESREPITKADSPADAIQISIAERGVIDADYIASLLGRERAEGVLEELASGSEPLLFMDPALGEYALRDAYLSGNVREKLKQAKAAGLFMNAAELEKVQPEDVGAHEIVARIGSPWVPTSVYEDFAKHLFGSKTNAAVTYVPLNSSFITQIRPELDAAATLTWGTVDYTGPELLSALLNNRDIKVTRKLADGGTTIDKEATDLANLKAQELRDKFNDWLFTDTDRAEKLIRTYNDTNNNYVVRQFDGSWLRFPGKVPDDVIKFRRHQRNVVARIIQTRTALLDHVVGAGKTFAIISAAMEMKRMGLVKKNLVVVPNHLVKQWAKDWYRLYPGAKVLTATKKDFERSNRRRFLARIATGDWDAVVMAHSSYGFLRPSPEFEAQFNEKQVQGIIDTIKAVEESGAEDRAKKRTVKQLEKMAERLENRIAALRDKPIDQLLDFSELGIDQQFVDEAHLFKNLMFTTKMQNVRGLGESSGSQRAYDMYVKINELYARNGGQGKGVVFATGTPISNSLAEMYHMMRYLMPQVMEQQGFTSFDAWANTFASIEQVWMQKASGDGYKASNRMSTFVNVAELLRMFDQVADTVTLDDIKAAYREENDGKEFPIPPLKGGRRTPISLTKSPLQERYMLALAARAEKVEKRRGPPQKGEDNILTIMMDGRKAAMDIRLVDKSVMHREEGGRIDEAANKLIERHKQWDHVRGTQLVFADLGTPLKTAKTAMAEYQALQARITAATDEVQTKANLGDEAALDILDDAEAASTELEAKGPDWLDGVQAALRGFSVYDDLKAALVERGIPADQIAFIHSYNTDDQKATLFREVNSGRIRVLMGSTEKLGAGTNVQERLVAEHHLDVPWKPSDVEQREGRIIRQGNKLYDEIPGFEVEILAYVTRDTLDMRMWQVQETKLKMINQLRSRTIGREMENAFEDMELSAGEMQAAATGNMDLLNEIKLRTDVKKLEQKKRSFDAQRSDLESRKRRAAERLRMLPREVEKARGFADAHAQYAEALSRNGKGWQATINGELYTDINKATTELARLIDAEQEVEGKKKKVKLDVEFNGTRYTNRLALSEAFLETRDDFNPVRWTFEGKEYTRREAIQKAIRLSVGEANASSTEVEIGNLGPYQVSVEGQGEDRLEVVVRANGFTSSTDVSAILERTDKAGALAKNAMSAALSMVNNAADHASYVQRQLANAQRDAAELENTQMAGEWPEQERLEAMRAKHREILQRLSAAKPTEATPAFEAAPRGWSQIDNSPEDLPPSPEEIRDEIEAVLSRLATRPDYTIALTYADLPASIRESTERLRGSKAGDWRAATVTTNGKVHLYFIANLFPSALAARQAAIHETVVHFGMRALLPYEEHMAIARGIQRDNPFEHRQRGEKEFGKTVRDALGRVTAGFDPENPEHIRVTSEELLAYYGMRYLDGGSLKDSIRRWFDRVLAMLRDAWNRLFGNDQPFDNLFFRQFLQRLQRGLKRGDGVEFEGESFAMQSNDPIYFSALTRAAESANVVKASPMQWLATLRNAPGVKEEEIQWTELGAWLSSLDRQATKAEVLDYLRAHEIRVEEVLKGAGVAPTPDERSERQDKRQALVVRLTALGYQPNFDPYEGHLIEIENQRDGGIFEYLEGEWEPSEAWPTTVAEYDLPEDVEKVATELGMLQDEISNEHAPNDVPMHSTRYDQYALPGGQNYRELLLTVPMLPSDSWEVFDKGAIVHGRYATKEEARSAAEALDKKFGRSMFDYGPAKERGYRSSHWNEPNILTHIRFDERVDADGKKTLFLQEIQSDWHQAGRRKGYRDSGNAEVLRSKFVAIMDELHRLSADRDPTTNRMREEKRWHELAVERDEAHLKFLKATEGVPDAPFKTTWPELAFKRMLRWAAEHNFDRIAWTTGEQQAERYNLRKTVSEVAYDPERKLLKARDLHDNKILEVTVEPDGIEQYVGKPVAERLLASPLNGPYHIVKGEGLELGGEGMRGFYDEMLPKLAAKLTKKYGGKVGATQIQTGSQMLPHVPTTVHSLDITPQMRAAALGGLPMFQSTDTRTIQMEDGSRRPITNADGRLIAEDVPAQRNFWRWFGGSKVVDSSGHPIVLYKGMYPYDYNQEGEPEITAIKRPSPFPAMHLNEPDIEIGAFFGSQEIANTFANTTTSRGAVFPVYVKLERPFEIDAQGNWAGNSQFGPQGKAFRDAMRSDKYDGVIIHNTKDEGTIYVTKQANQAKSAIGNAGSFDPRNDDIAFQSEQVEAMARGIGKDGKSGYAAMAQNVIDAWNKKIGWRYGALGRLPDARKYLIERYKTLGGLTDVKETARHVFEALSEATPEDKARVFDYLTTRGATPDAIESEKVRSMAIAVKGAIDNQGQALVEAGLLSEESYEFYKDQYLPRVYLRHILDDDKAPRSMGSGKTLSDMGYLKKRKDIPEEVRAVILGEITDPAFLAAYSMARVQRDLSIMAFLNTIANNADWTPSVMLIDWDGRKVSPFWLQSEAKQLRRQADHYDKPMVANIARRLADTMDSLANGALEQLGGEDLSDFKQIPDSARYGALRGLWVRREIHEDLVGAYNFVEADTWYEKAFSQNGILGHTTQLWKTSKVALNLPSHIRNTLGNAIMLHLSGVNAAMLPVRMVQALNAIVSKDDWYQIAKKYGLEEATFANQELYRIRDEWLQLQKSMPANFSTAKVMLARISNAVGDVYRFEEALFKIMKLIDAMQSDGLNEADAMIESHKWVFDYSLVPRFVRWARNAPFGIPFLSYAYFAAPRLLETAVKKPWKFLPYVAMSYALTEAVMAAFGADDDDLDKVKKAYPDWMQSRGGMYLLPSRDANGNLQVTDVGYITPWGQWADAMQQLKRGEFQKTTETFGILSGPIPDAISAWQTGIDTFTHKEIAPAGDPAGMRALAYLNYAWTMAAPSFVTSGGALGKIKDAYTGKVDPRSGDPTLTKAQAWARLFGISIYPVNPEETRARNIRRLAFEIDETRKRLKQALSDRNVKTPEQRRGIREQYQEELNRRQQEMQDYQKESIVPKAFKRAAADEELTGRLAPLVEGKPKMLAVRSLKDAGYPALAELWGEMPAKPRPHIQRVFEEANYGDQRRRGSDV